MSSYEIRKVNNGYIVMPSTFVNTGQMTNGDEINVFKTLEEVKVFLLEVMGHPNSEE